MLCYSGMGYHFSHLYRGILCSLHLAYFSSSMGILHIPVSIRTLMLKWWKYKSYNNAHKLVFQALPIIICWNLWKHRCAVKYGEKQPQLARVKFLIYKDISHLLCSAFPYIPWPTGWKKISYVEKCRQEIKVTSVYWSKPPAQMVKLNFDGSAITNRGKIGAGGGHKRSSWRSHLCICYTIGTGDQQSSRGGSCYMGTFLVFEQWYTTSYVRSRF